MHSLAQRLVPLRRYVGFYKEHTNSRDVLPIFANFPYVKLSSVQLLALRCGARKFHIAFECECSYLTLRLHYVTLSS